MITVEEAIRSNDLVIGIAVIAICMIAAAAWFGTVIYARRSASSRKKAVEKAVRRTEQKCRKAEVKAGAANFRKWQDEKEAHLRTRKALEDLQVRFDALKADYENLQADAASCPAFGMVGKRGFQK